MGHEGVFCMVATSSHLLIHHLQHPICVSSWMVQVVIAALSFWYLPNRQWWARRDLTQCTDQESVVLYGRSRAWRWTRQISSLVSSRSPRPLHSNINKGT